MMVSESLSAASLIEISVKMVSERGIAALSLRSLASAASVSPASVLYHFRNKAGLWHQVYDALEGKIARWGDRQVELFANMPIDRLSAASVSSALTTALLPELGGALVAFVELGNLSRRDGLDLGGVQNLFFEHEDEFIDRMFASNGLPRETGKVWWYVIRGLVPLLMLEDNAPPRNALIHLLMQRVADRLAGRRYELLPLSTAKSPALGDIARIKGKQQLVDAAIRTIAYHGVDGLTHRRVASEAGLSLALTTYHYKTKIDIVIDAFLEAQRRGVGSLISETLSPAQFLPSVILDEHGELRTAMSALASLSLAAVRSLELRDLARTLRHTRGVDALRWLQARRLGSVDLFDGIIWSAVGTPIIERALALSPPERRNYLENESGEIFAALFSTTNGHSD